MSCDVSVLFTPQSVGSLGADITVTNNTQNVAPSTQTIAASGTAPPPATTTAVTFSPTSPVYGQSVTMTATVSSTGTPTGMVAFTDETTSAKLASSVTLTSGVATTSTSTLAVGSHSIQAAYTPVGNFLSSNGSNSVTIAKAAPARHSPFPAAH
jgi:hypothetical protein